MVSGVQGSNIIVVQKSAEAVSSSTKGARRSYQNTADAWRKQGACGAPIKDVQISISIPGMCCQLPQFWMSQKVMFTSLGQLFTVTHLSCPKGINVTMNVFWKIQLNRAKTMQIISSFNLVKTVTFLLTGVYEFSREQGCPYKELHYRTPSSCSTGVSLQGIMQLYSINNKSFITKL